MKSTPLVLSVLAVSVATVASQQFCPLEMEGNFQCRSRRNSYKCAAFFENLSGTTSPITWLGAMPDALRKSRVRNNKAFLKSFGLPVSRKSFLLHDKCGELTANSRCYVIMQKASKEPLDSCQETILNETGGRVVGDALCAKAAAHTPPGTPQFNITIGFYYSACGEEWLPTKDSLTKVGAAPLVVREKLCCSADGRFFRCDGSAFNDSCPARTPKALDEDEE